WQSQPESSIQRIRPGQIVLLDTIGELASVYSLARVAFVGGSLVPAGGHNPLEPAQFGVPIVMGPNYANFRDIVDRLSSADAIAVDDLPVLQGTFQRLLTDGRAGREMGERARKAFESEAGATETAVDALLGIVGLRVGTHR